MTFKCHLLKLVYELLLVICSGPKFCRIIHRFRDTSCFNAKNHILPTPLLFDLYFEGHAARMLRRHLAPENYNYGAAIMAKKS